MGRLVGRVKRIMRRMGAVDRRGSVVVELRGRRVRPFVARYVAAATPEFAR
jgi:hypothetical protein